MQGDGLTIDQDLALQGMRHFLLEIAREQVHAVLEQELG